MTVLLVVLFQAAVQGQQDYCGSGVLENDLIKRREIPEILNSNNDHNYHDN